MKARTQFPLELNFLDMLLFHGLCEQQFNSFGSVNFNFIVRQKKNPNESNK